MINFISTGAASTQEQLALAAQNAVSTIVQLSEAVKFGAASLGSNNPESQVMLINSVRDVAGALYDLIHSTKSAAGKGKNDPSMMALKESAQVNFVKFFHFLIKEWFWVWVHGKKKNNNLKLYDFKNNSNKSFSLK